MADVRQVGTDAFLNLDRVTYIIRQGRRLEVVSDHGVLHFEARSDDEMETYVRLLVAKMIEREDE